MRKVVLLMALLCIGVISSQAQLSRTVYGISLGSNLESVKTVLNSKGLFFDVSDSEIGLSVMVKNPYFAGVQWDALMVSFEQNQIYSISFIKQRTSNLS